jgi:flagellar biosynthetic protein FliP
MMARFLRLAPVLLLALVVAPEALPQTVSVDLGTGQGLTSGIVQLIAAITVLSLAPSILVMTTSFVRIVIVLSLVRTAIGLQNAPPNSVIISLALFLTAFVMAPTFMASYEAGIQPYMAEAITLEEAIPRTLGPIQAFMGAHVNEADVAMFAGMANIQNLQSAADAPFHVLAPAFMISELKRAFIPGDRPCRLVHPDGDGDDDAAARHDLAAIQVDLLRAGRWLAAAVRRAGRKLHAIPAQLTPGGALDPT